jgi:AcrR family transcriptional regulator
MLSNNSIAITFAYITFIMNSSTFNINFIINSNLYKKDPVSSELGANIIGQSIEMIDDLGFENFTFKKLAVEISSTEASIYRYFDSKHQLLSYLITWYWHWMDYRLNNATANIQDPKERLNKAIFCLTEEIQQDGDFQMINEQKLHHIVITESSKVYLSKTVDKDNESGYFTIYKAVVERVSSIILEIRPEFKYPHMLVSTVIEGAHHQRFFAQHLPRLTDQFNNEDSVTRFYSELVQRELEIYQKSK